MRSSPSDKQLRIAGSVLKLSALLFIVDLTAAGLCPSRCRCNDDLLSASCEYGGLDVVPIQLNPEIQYLDLSRNRIVSLHMAFDFYGSLESLDLSSNLIHTLGSNNFRLQQRLLRLNLSSNGIRFLAKTAFHGLATLRFLDLSSNNITEVDEQAFRYTSELESLDLGSNGITSLTTGFLHNLHRIRNLVLRGNSLIDAPASNLVLAPSLEVLDLADNLIQELKWNSLPLLPALVRLDLSNNAICNVANAAFEQTPGLESLNLTGNNLTSVPSRALSRLVVLRTLILSRNPLDSLHDLAFQNLFELRTLELDECAIMHVNSRTFADNVNLEKISMDGNRNLSELPNRLLYATGNLRWISLRRCNLASLQPTQIPVKELASLYVGGNPFICNCSVHWLWNMLRTEELRNGTKLEIDSPEIVCADEKFAGKALIKLTEGSLHCRLNLLYLSLSVTGCVAVAVAIFGFIVHIAKIKRKKHIPAYTISTKPELLVYVSISRDKLSGKHKEPYSRRLIDRTEDLIYAVDNQDYHQSQRKSQNVLPESSEINMHETSSYFRPYHHENDVDFDLFYQQRVPSSSTLFSQKFNYLTPSESHSSWTQEIYSFTDMRNWKDEQSFQKKISLYRNHNTDRHQYLAKSMEQNYDYEYEYQYSASVPPQKSHVIFV